MSTAPVAPGRLGEQLDPAATQVYLADLDTWVQDRRADLDEIDQQALASPDGTRLTSDLTLALALWKAVADRLRLLVATWDGGRVGPKERERLSVLVWGRLDTTFDGGGLAGPAAATSPSSTTSGAGSLAVSLPEACRLVDALVQQLRVALALDPAADAHAQRLKQIRAQLERLRDQATLEPPATQGAVRRQIDELAGRADDLAGRVSRGGDIGGLVGPLENAAARLERDLIVGGVQRREARGQFVAAQELQADLVARGAAVRSLADTAVRTVIPAPLMAVPDVAALGPVPTDLAQLTAFVGRLRRVEAATNLAEAAYSGVLHEHGALQAVLDAQVVRAQAAGLTRDADVVGAQQAARQILERQPSPVEVARALVEVHAAWITVLTGPNATGQREESA